MGIVRKTKTVSLLQNVFESSEKALSVVQLVDQMIYAMNKTTVYRILDRLEKEGLVHSFFGKDGLKWYAKKATCCSTKSTGTHQHFQCNHCGTIECLDVNISIPQLDNRYISSTKILIQGTCPSCLS